MRLKDDFFSIESHTATPDTDTFHIRLNASHFIYKAHFPGMPVTPGVCIIQTARELLETLIGTPLTITAIKNVKFVAVISPAEHTAITYTFGRTKRENDEVKTAVEVRSADTLFAIISFTCRTVSEAGASSIQNTK